MRLTPQTGERINREHQISFSFEGKPVVGFAGDTIGSALFAAGRRVFSRSFKYHRPRGLMCCSGQCPNCMMTVDGVPNVRVCVEPLREAADVRAQNVIGNVDRDFLAVIDRVGARFTPVGFYYRTMIRPRRLWPMYEALLRRLAGLGYVGGAERRYDTEHRHVDVLVIGGGPSGWQAASDAAKTGAEVVLVDEHGNFDADATGFEVLAPARAIGVYEGGLVPVEAGTILHRIRAERIVVATGTIEQPLVFPGNDLVGVMLPQAVVRLVDEFALQPGVRAVVVAHDERSLRVTEQLARAGVDIVRVVDLRSERIRTVVATGRKGRLRSVSIDGVQVECDLLVASGSRQPAYSLLAQAGARIEYDSRRSIFLPTELPANVAAVGSVTGLAAPVQNPPSASYRDGGGDKCFVCMCEDVTEKDVVRAIAEGFESIEMAKRYTTVTMGPCQGKLCHLSAIRLLARQTETSEDVIGTTTARPSWQPVELGVIAGRSFEQMKRTPLHATHEQLGARMMWSGGWQRAYDYGDASAETLAVHDAVGVIDVSTLGKILIEGPDAVDMLERLYPNTFRDLAIGRIRYSVLTSDAGRIMDDGTISRLGDELFYVTTTSSGAEAVCEWFEWWNASWGYDVEIVNVTGALAAINLAGPRAREVLDGLADGEVTNDALRYLDAREMSVAGTPCLALRIGFVGELGYELHCPAGAAQHVWDQLVANGARPFGLEAQRVLRLEKAHPIPGQDTDSESTLASAGMSGILKFSKGDFVGRWAAEHGDERGIRERLVGFTIEGCHLPPEGAQVVRDGRVTGRVTSARVSERLGRIIGIAWVEPEYAQEGAAISVRADGVTQRASVTLSPFYDPAGERLRS